MFIMLWNTLKYRLHYLQNESVSMKIFLLNLHKATKILSDLGNPTPHLIYYAYQIFSTKTNGLTQPQAVNVEEACTMET